MKPIVFEFAELAGGKAEKKLAQVFSRAGANVVQSSVGPMKRTSGISFKDVLLTFADGQSVTLSVKQSGDIYKVNLNGKALPIKAQDDHYKAVKEMVAAMDAGRSKFQAALAKAKAALPKGIKSAAPKMETALKAKAADLDTAIANARGKVEELRKELGEGATLDSADPMNPTVQDSFSAGGGDEPASDVNARLGEAADAHNDDEGSGDVSDEQGALFGEPAA